MSALEKMNKQQRSNARAVFESWEMILFKKLKTYGKIEQETYDTALADITMNLVPKRLAKEYLDEQIQDMKDQIAEQRAAVS